MYVKKVWETPNAEELITYIARVSNPKGQENQTPESVERLINFMLREGHVSPFSMVNVCFEVETTRAISAQIIRHFSISVQEFCLAGDSLVRTPDGLKKIGDLYKQQENGQLDKRVYSLNTETGLLEIGGIKEVFSTGKKQLYEVSLGDKAIRTTLEHKFLTKVGFTCLEDLRVGSLVGVYEDGLVWKEISSIEKGLVEDTYDIQVDPYHNYIANEIVVHNSQRYQDVGEIDYFECPEIRYKGTTNRQSSLEWPETSVSQEVHEENERLRDEALGVCKQNYEKMVENGVALESARMILPVTTKTRLFLNGSLRSWIFYLKSRNSDHAQKEHRLIAQEIEGLLRKVFPITFSGIDKYGV